jgi:parvulin-like peptidyl-prolyl isomerase
MSNESAAWLPLPLVALAGLAPFAACQDGGKGQDRSDWIAVVNGAPITAEAFSRELAFSRRTSAGVLPQTDEELLAFRRAVLEEMIDRLLALSATHEAGINVPPESVEREILRLRAEYHGSGFNEALAEGQVSQQELRERTRSRLLVERYFVDEVFSRLVVTDAEIEAYYNEHTAELGQPEQVRAAQIVVRSAEEAHRVLGEIRKGMGFDEAARRFSLSPDAKVGGDLGFFQRGVMPAVFDQTCFSLPPGRISDVVASDYGFHIFKVLDRRGAEQRPLEKVRAEVEKLLLRRKQDEVQKKVMSELRAKANIKVDEAALAKAP